MSSVSVSLVYFFPLIVINFQSSDESNGLPLVFIFIFSGNFTGSSFSGILKILFLSSYAIGIGHPQYLCLDIQSFKR